VLYTDGAYVEQMTGFLVLLDMRGVEAAKKSHIQGAVALDLKNLEKEKGQFPLDKKAPIILYTDKSDWRELQPAVKMISSWGYSRIRVLEGGIEGWLAKNRPTQKGEVRTSIYYVPRPRPGEISGDEFMNVVKIKPANILLLDVRNSEETAEGILEGAVNIPLGSLQGRLNELPKSKEIIVYCRNGVRAEMGYQILKSDGGYKARFLNDKLATKGNEFFCCYK